jgi:hypothetical protein
MQAAANESEQPKKPFKPVVSAKLIAQFADHDGPPRPELSSISDMQLLESSLASINELYRRAKSGTDESTDYIFRLATYTTTLLARLAQNPSPLLLDYARRNAMWPFFYSPKAGFLEPYQADLDRLEIGKDCQLNVNPKSRWSWQGEARLRAIRIHHFVQYCKTMEQAHKHDNPDVDVIEGVEPQMRELFKAARVLPPLSKSNAKLWMDMVGWPFVMLMTKGQPEKDSALRKLGIHRARHTETSKSGSKTSESNIRDGIKKLITQALQNMATQS